VSSRTRGAHARESVLHFGLRSPRRLVLGNHRTCENLHLQSAHQLTEGTGLLWLAGMANAVRFNFCLGGACIAITQ
jgi:hypothetical protein